MKLISAYIFFILMLIPVYGVSQNQRFLILKDTTNASNIKRLVEIEIPTPISKERLGEIADNIKNKGNTGVKNLFITFKLKDDTDSAFWASVSYTPERSINIYGNTIEENDHLRNLISNYSPQGMLIGVWKFRSCAIGLYKTNNKYFENIICHTGMSKSFELKYASSNKGKKFQNDLNESMIINKNDKLEMFNGENKLYYVGEKLK